MITLLAILSIIAICALAISFVVLDTAISVDDTWAGCMLMVGGWALIILIFILGEIFC